MYYLFKVENLCASVISNITYDDSPSFSGIIAGECTGEMWVDDFKNPNIALVFSFAVGGFSILGELPNIESYNEFAIFIVEDIFVQLKDKGIDYFEFSIESKEARPYILDIFKNRVIQSEDEYTFRRDYKYDKITTTPVSYKIFKVDYEFLEMLETGEFVNKEFLTERLLMSWSTYENFLSKSVAFVAVNKNKIIAVIIGTARFKNIIPIDIETEDEHRKKGVALTLIRYFVNECMDNGYVAQWDCMDSNIASNRIAEKAGFEFIKKSPVYWFEI